MGIAMSSGTMQAFVVQRVGEVELVEKPIPRPGPDDAVIRTTAAMVCTSDVHSAKGGMDLPAGRTLGHESVGVVHEVGSAVVGLRPGERVAVGACTPCHRCRACQLGHSSHCHHMLGGFRSVNQRDGNLAEYFVVNDAEANVARIPDAVSDHQAVYVTDMLTTGFMGVENARLRLGETIAIFGQGPVGLSATIGARLTGAGRIVAIESVPARQRLAREFGADDVVDPTAGDVVDQLLELTDGAGLDAAVEAAGRADTFDQAFRSLNPYGRLSNVGYHDGDTLSIDLPAFGVGHADKTITAGCAPGGGERLGRLLRLLEAGRFDPTPMTTHRFAFGEVGHAYDLMDTKGDGIIKPFLEFT
jgi:isopropanol dehydrogenase (NADP+)